MRILEAIEAANWAIADGWVEKIHQIASRENEITPEALEAYKGRKLAMSERATQRGDTAVIYLEGPMFHRANLFVEISGATSYDIVRRDFQAALDNPEIRSIVLSMDTPGGMVAGCSELANAIYEARGKKRVVAYVSSMALSAGYWLASAAEEIVISDSGEVGSIGAVITITDTSQRDERSGVRRIEFVSSASPEKRPDIKTDAGRAAIQRMVDEHGKVFIEAVARNRGVKAATVMEKFGRGGIEIGQSAVSLGMADRLGSFEGLLSSLALGGRSYVNPKGRMLAMSDTNKPAEPTGITKADLDRAVAEATANAFRDAQARSGAILGSEDAKKLPTLANHLAFSTGLTADDAKAIMAAAVKDIPAEGGAGQPQQAPSASHQPAPGSTADAPKQTTAADFVAHKIAAGGVAGAEVVETKTEKAKSGWSKAVKQANAPYAARA